MNVFCSDAVQEKSMMSVDDGNDASIYDETFWIDEQKLGCQYYCQMRKFIAM